MKQTIEYRTRGTCSQTITVTLDGEIIESVAFRGGCHGNLQGISRLVEGMNAREAVSRLKGIKCGFKPTSCPDQLAQALEIALAKKETAEGETQA